jgi:hypothetical protein
MDVSVIKSQMPRNAGDMRKATNAHTYINWFLSYDLTDFDLINTRDVVPTL